MRCEDVERLLSGQTVAEPSAAENAAIEDHLASCQACKERWGLAEQSQELHDAAKALRARQGAEHSLLAKLDAEEGPAQPGPAPLQPEMPKQIGGFELLELLGRGGMGSVYRARQVSLGRLVALKVIARRLAADERFVARFEREARAAAAVHHPNIVAVYSVGEDSGQHYIAMELVAGEGLDALVKREGPLPQDRALRMMKQVTAALAAAHEADIVHRDIKPSNILLAAEESVKVADFGLAKRMATDVTVTQTGAMMGTPLYHPPEAARGERYDARSDLYSLGATFYHLLAGKPPFEGEKPRGGASLAQERGAAVAGVECLEFGDSLGGEEEARALRHHPLAPLHRRPFERGVLVGHHGGGGGGGVGFAFIGPPSSTSTSSTQSVCDLASVVPSPKSATPAKPAAFVLFQSNRFTGWSSSSSVMPLSASKSKVHFRQRGSRLMPRYWRLANQFLPSVSEVA